MRPLAIAHFTKTYDKAYSKPLDWGTLFSDKTTWNLKILNQGWIFGFGNLWWIACTASGDLANSAKLPTGPIRPQANKNSSRFALRILSGLMEDIYVYLFLCICIYITLHYMTLHYITCFLCMYIYMHNTCCMYRTMRKINVVCCHICIYIYIYVYIYVYIYMYIDICIYTCIYIHIYIHTFIYIYTYVCVCLCVCVCVCGCVYVYAYVYVCMYVCR